MTNPPRDTLAEHPITIDPSPKAPRRPETLSLFPDIGETPLGKDVAAAPQPMRKQKAASPAAGALFPGEEAGDPAPDPGPPPASGAPEAGSGVSFARRIVAGLADLLILCLVGSVQLAAGAFFLDLRFPPPALLGLASFLALVALVLLVLVPFVWGTTPGMALADLRVVAEDGGSPTLPASFRRFAGFALTGLLAGIPLLVAAFDRRGRTPADLFSGTTLVAVRRETVAERVG
jgi:uncharacterized RDD family membrane protein YckC